MKVLGIHIGKSQMRYSILSGTQSEPILEHKDKLVTPDPQDVPPLMDWYDTQFRSLLELHRPDRVVYRLGLNPSKQQIITSAFPFGILNLHCFSRQIPVRDYTPPSFVPSKLGLAKSADLHRHCDEVLGKRPPYWDKMQRDSVLAAWFELPK